jgi:hypothetical protein
MSGSSATKAVSSTAAALELTGDRDILSALFNFGDAGLDVPTIAAHCTLDEKKTNERLQHLIGSGLVRADSDKYTLVSPRVEVQKGGLRDDLVRRIIADAQKDVAVALQKYADAGTVGVKIVQSVLSLSDDDVVELAREIDEIVKRFAQKPGGTRTYSVLSLLVPKGE